MKISIVGDILHSRVARSDIMGFRCSAWTSRWSARRP
jgi:aspartate carbamoyltransferase catalytic subunit